MSWYDGKNDNENGLTAEEQNYLRWMIQKEAQAQAQHAEEEKGKLKQTIDELAKGEDEVVQGVYRRKVSAGGADDQELVKTFAEQQLQAARSDVQSARAAELANQLQALMKNPSKNAAEIKRLSGELDKALGGPQGNYSKAKVVYHVNRR